MPPNYPLGIWPEHWAAPYESDISIRCKYYWLNCFQDVKLGSWWPEPDFRSDKFFGDIHKSLRAPAMKGWRYLDLPMAICPSCLDYGYHSDLPNMVGVSHCPFHGDKLERLCRHCSRPLKFEEPRYGMKGAYICSWCKKTIIPLTKGFWLKWGSINHRLLVRAFHSLKLKLDSINERLADVAEKADSCYFDADLKNIYSMYAGRNTTFDISYKYSMWILQSELEIRSHSFSLIEDPRDQLEYVAICEEAAISEIENSFLPPSRGKTSFVRSKLSDYGRLILFLDDHLIDVFISIRKSLWHYECNRHKATSPRGRISEHQRKLLFGLSAWRVAKVLSDFHALSTLILRAYELERTDLIKSICDEYHQVNFRDLTFSHARLLDRKFDFLIDPAAFTAPAFFYDNHKGCVIFEVKIIDRHSALMEALQSSIYF